MCVARDCGSRRVRVKKIIEYLGEADDNADADSPMEMGYVYLVRFPDDPRCELELTLGSYCIDTDADEGKGHIHFPDDDEEEDEDEEWDED